MEQRRQHLQEMLKELEAELARVDTLDDETRKMLEEAAAEIEHVLAGNEPLADSSPPVRHRLSSTIERFEASHPTLTGVLSRLVDLLGQLGI